MRSQKLPALNPYKTNPNNQTHLQVDSYFNPIAEPTDIYDCLGIKHTKLYSHVYAV